MKTILFGIVALSLAQTVGTYSAKADDEGLRLVSGAINADGTSQFTTNTFTSSHLGTGHYLITFAPFVFGKTSPVCIVVPLGTNLAVRGLFLKVSSCEIFIATDAGINVDEVFVFTASPATGNVDAQ